MRLNKHIRRKIQGRKSQGFITDLYVKLRQTDSCNMFASNVARLKACMEAQSIQLQFREDQKNMEHFKDVWLPG